MTPLLSLVGMGLGPGTLPYQEVKHSHTACVRLITLCANILLCCKPNVCAFVLLKCEWHMTPAGSGCYICLLREKDGIFSLRHKRDVCKWIALHWLSGETRWPWRTNTQIGADLALSPLCVSKVLFHLVLDCVVLSLDTKIQLTEVFGVPHWD